MSTKISENTNIQLDIKTVIAIISITASFVGMYYTLQADIEEAKTMPPTEVTRLEYELKEEWNEKMIMQLKDQVEVLEETADILKEEIKITSAMIQDGTEADAMLPHHVVGAHSRSQLLSCDQPALQQECGLISL